MKEIFDKRTPYVKQNESQGKYKFTSRSESGKLKAHICINSIAVVATARFTTDLANL
jgi:hypothetical protein